jgi:hypothetical protein
VCVCVCVDISLNIYVCMCVRVCIPAVYLDRPVKHGVHVCISAYIHMHILAVDLDIQGQEIYVLTDPPSLRAMNAKVYSLHVGTHRCFSCVMVVCIGVCIHVLYVRMCLHVCTYLDTTW